jgi:hypothetical protein
VEFRREQLLVAFHSANVVPRIKNSVKTEKGSRFLDNANDWKQAVDIWKCDKNRECVRYTGLRHDFKLYSPAKKTAYCQTDRAVKVKHP